jgi:hypothetical protein
MLSRGEPMSVSSTAQVKPSPKAIQAYYDALHVYGE